MTYQNYHVCNYELSIQATELTFSQYQYTFGHVIFYHFEVSIIHFQLPLEIFHNTDTGFMNQRTEVFSGQTL